jgi:hypothetical protein
MGMLIETRAHNDPLRWGSASLVITTSRPAPSWYAGPQTKNPIGRNAKYSYFETNSCLHLASEGSAGSSCTLSHDLHATAYEPISKLLTDKTNLRYVYAQYKT